MSPTRHVTRSTKGMDAKSTLTTEGKMTVEDEMIICRDAHIQNASRNPENIARMALEQLAALPVLDEPMPSVCKSHHCTERGAWCAKCAYTAMGTMEK